mmetsp:Transcript_977/g.2909  ORF Transcript_977/g.2909 Transcript_977/m.2909 type:complete len:397 (+) Transcript_977:954-2144(+)
MSAPAPADPESYTFRDTDKLYVLPETAECLLSRCVPCAYKLLVAAPTKLDDEKLTPPCHRNVRPELCPRQAMANGSNSAAEPESSNEGSDAEEEIDAAAQTAEKVSAGPPARVGLYRPSQHILVVGDGDFTFSLALMRSLQSPARMVCTSFQSGEEVRSIYPEADQTLSDLSEAENVVVQHEVDATKLDVTLESKGPFDRVIFNFPCIAFEEGQDGQADQLDANKNLIGEFIRGAIALLRPKGEVHIVHKTKEPFSWWKIPEQVPEGVAASMVRRVVFDRSVYPGYVPRKVGQNKSFPVFDAVTYCFAPTAEAGDNGCYAVEPEPGAALLANELAVKYDLLRLTPKRLLQAVTMLQLASKDGPAHAAKKRLRGDFISVPRRDTKKSRKRQRKRGKR